MSEEVDLAALRHQLGQPEGCVGLTLVRAEGNPRRLLKEVVGRHVYLLDYEPDLLTLRHSTPGAGTWTATLPLDGLPGRDALTLIVAWSPDELRLSAADPEDPSRGRVAVGERDTNRLLADRDGRIVGVGAEATGVRVHVGGQQTAGPPAIDLWDETREAVRILLTGTSAEGFLHEVVTTNSALVMLVTGLETYCQERFVEVEGEGVPMDPVAFLSRFGTADEKAVIRGGGVPDSARVGEPMGRASVLAERVNFQNFDDLKRAFSKAYGIRLGVDLQVTNRLLERVRTLVGYRHRIVHVSPMATILNQGPGIPDADWEWAKTALATSASEQMDEFIRALHAATLRLRP